MNFYTDIVLSANWGFECDKGGAIEVFELYLMRSDGIRFYEAIDDEDFEFGNCDATNLFINCKTWLAVINVSSAKA